MYGRPLVGDRRRRRELEAEVPLQDPRGNGRRGVGAEASSLDRHRNDDLGLIRGRQRDVPRLIGHRKPAVVEAALGGARLPGDVDREVAEDRVGRAARLHRSPRQPADDR